MNPARITSTLTSVGLPCVVVVVTVIGLPAAIQSQELTAITEVAAPVFLFPDAARTPLATLPRATRVEVIEHNEQWTNVAFNDTLLGKRIGWMQTDKLLLLKVGATTAAGAPPLVPAPPPPAATPVPPPTAEPPAPTVVPPAPQPPTPIARPMSSRYRPSPAQVSNALVIGARQKNKLHGLSLVDSGQVWLAALNSGLNGRNSAGTSTGFSVVVYTPIAWIRQQAARSAKEYRQLTPNEVTDEMQQPVLRVTVNPDTPTMVTASGMVGTSSVQHVVLRDARRLTAVQPFTKEATVEEVSNAMGGRKVFQGLIATFPMAALDEIRGGSGEDEFLITVIGSTGEEKDFKVKRKHFERLPLH